MKRASERRGDDRGPALDKQAFAALGAHLEASIRTGHECMYAPSAPVEWDCRP